MDNGYIHLLTYLSSINSATVEWLCCGFQKVKTCLEGLKLKAKLLYFNVLKF